MEIGEKRATDGTIGTRAGTTAVYLCCGRVLDSLLVLLLLYHTLMTWFRGVMIGRVIRNSTMTQ